MTSFLSRSLLCLVAASWSVGTGAALGESSSRPNPEFVCTADLFSGYIPTFQSGDALIKEGTFAVNLQPAADVVYFTQFSGGAPQGFGGLVTLEGIAAGRYAIVLSREARLTAVQYRPFHQILIEQGKAGSICPGVAEIVVESGPLSLQIRGAIARSIMIGMVRLPD